MTRIDLVGVELEALIVELRKTASGELVPDQACVGMIKTVKQVALLERRGIWIGRRIRRPGAAGPVEFLAFDEITPPVVLIKEVQRGVKVQIAVWSHNAEGHRGRVEQRPGVLFEGHAREVERQYLVAALVRVGRLCGECTGLRNETRLGGQIGISLVVG